jgi:hypothetical protein
MPLATCTAWYPSEITFGATSTCDAVMGDLSMEQNKDCLCLHQVFLHVISYNYYNSFEITDTFR